MPYFTCITYKENIECKSTHVCNVFPVFIGSKLDEEIVKIYFKNQLGSSKEEFDKCINDLYGIVYNNSPQYFSNIFTNRKEFIHMIIDRNNENNKQQPTVTTTIASATVADTNRLCELYVYDVDDRGHRFNLNMDATTLIYRNNYGIEMNVSSEKFNDFIKKSKFHISKKHLNFQLMGESFRRFLNLNIDIDSLANKNILSIINTLQRLLQYARRCPEQCVQIMRYGSIEKFASMNINYQTTSSSSSSSSGAPSVPVNSSTSTSQSQTTTNNKRKLLKDEPKKKSISNNMALKKMSFSMKRLQPNQIGCMRHVWDKCIVRPIPSNVSNIPIDTEFFICLAEKSMRIDAPNRWMTLMPNVCISNHLLTQKYAADNLNSLLTKLLDSNVIIPAETIVQPTDIMIAVNGGLATTYILNTKKFTSYDLFIICKQMQPFSEIYINNNICMINILDGIPFICIKSDQILKYISSSLSTYSQKYMFISPLELKMPLFVKYLRPQLYNMLFGPNCPSTLQEYFPYITSSKLMSIVYLRNRFFLAESSLKYFDLTIENSCVYIDNVKRHNDNDNDILDNEAFIKLNTIFSSNPQITGDGYILSDDIKVNTIIIQRCRFEFDMLYGEDNITFFTKQNTSLQLYDAYGQCLRKYYHIMQIQRMSGTHKRLKCKFYPQVKLYMTETQTTNGYIYNLYKYYDERHFLNSIDQLDISVTATTVLNRRRIKKVYLTVLTKLHQPNCFDGLKVSEQCGQKGLVIQQNTDNFKQIHNLPKKPDICASIFSGVGRVPLIMFKNMSSNQNKGVDQKKILNAHYPFAILKNISSNMCSYGRMRVDLGLCKIMAVNNCNKTLYQLQQDTYSKEERGSFLPTKNLNALGVLGLIKSNVIFFDEFNNVCNLMKKTFIPKNSITNK
ncbi:LEF8-like protein [Glossina pallidipes salivary gland hypertrophy virus]|uniref:LEF8-like protein n=1 Tax=Glossina hytrovirus (isolate Glossina pallidipes/Ethiopia/Seibersdorf/-) TaxID=379529 RepID=A0A0Y0JHV0_GHVS|nr:LEF8-like protein [Glossina pallidipes salivary gland hypertrophy virus]